MNHYLIHLTCICAIAAACGLLYIPLQKRPLSEDDGNWLYLAVFWKNGVRMYKNFIQIFGYFGAPWLAAAAYNILRAKDLRFFLRFKAVWYICNALSVYWLVFVFTGDAVFAIAAALLFAAATAVPNTLFFLTYGEHYFILPINLSIIFSCYGFSGSSWWFLASGLAAGWAVQIKPTALLFGICLPVSFLFRSSWAVPVSFYFAAFLGLNLLPMALVSRYKNNSAKTYLRINFGQALTLLRMIVKKTGLTGIAGFLKEDDAGDQAAIYLKSHHQNTASVQWASFKKFMLPALKDLYAIPVLAALQIPALFFSFSLLSFSMLVLLLLYLAMQQAQKNYYTPHFNPCWMPLSVLAAKSLADGAAFLAAASLSWLAGLLMAALLARIAFVIVNSFSEKELKSHGYMGPMLGSLNSLAAAAGQYIREHSKEADKLLIWGDHPSVYLYAGREVFNTDYLFLYLHHNRMTYPNEMKKLLTALREDPPEWILFFNYKFDDGWNMAALADAIQTPYDQVQAFRLTDEKGSIITTPDGVRMLFPLWRRRDGQFKEMLIERALAPLSTGKAGQSGLMLRRIVQKFPDDPEATLRLAVLEAGENAEPREILNEAVDDAGHPLRKAFALMLTAEFELSRDAAAEALNLYLKAFEVIPENARCLNGLGECCLRMGQDDQAFRLLKRALELNPFYADACNNMGALLAQKGKAAAAADCFKRALSLIPQHPDARCNLETVETMLQQHASGGQA